MSAVFRAQDSISWRVADAAGAIADCPDQAGRYLTDGVDLYRLLGAVRRGMGEMVGLEDCRSLELILLPIGEH